MKKVLVLLVMLCSMFTMFCGMAYAAEVEDVLTLTMQIGNPIMTVNGVQKEIEPSKETVPAIVNNRTLVPIRAIVEELGGTVTWDQNSQTATLTYENNTIRLTINDTIAYFNGEAYTLDVAPATINSRTMMPIRFIAEHFQFLVDWNQAEQIISITKNTQSAGNDGSAFESAVISPSEGTSQSRALVIYFSATGNTRVLAEKVAEVAAADLQEIVPEVAYTDEDLNYNNSNCRANQEINSDIHPDIQTLSADIEQYDVIFLGYPIWWGQCPPPVQTFLDTYDLSGKTIMPFCTSGSSGISGSLSKINQLCPDSTVTNGFRGTSSTTNVELSTWFTDNGFQSADEVNIYE